MTRAAVWETSFLIHGSAQDAAHCLLLYFYAKILLDARAFHVTKGGEKMAKRENVLEKLIGKTTRPEGELEAIDRRLHENTARCFDGVLSLLL